MTLNSLKTSALFVLLSLFLIVPGFAQADEKPVYMVVMLDITDEERFWSEYVPGLGPIHARHGVKVIAASKNTDVLEGSYTQNFSVILKFPNADAQKAWHSDPEYQPLKQLRLTELTDPKNSTILLLPTYTPAAK